MTRSRIVIVTYNWPPRNAIGTHRPYSWARYWCDAGAKVTVLTAKKQQFDAPLDLYLPDLPGVDVIETAYGRAQGILGHALKSDRLRRFTRAAKTWLQKRQRLSIDPRAAWHNAAHHVAVHLANESDVVVSTFGPPAAHLIANFMKLANPDLRWVADYRDLWSQERTLARSDDEHARTLRIELQTVGENADLITAVSKDMVSRLQSLTGKKAVLVPNGFDIDEDELQRNLAGRCSKPKGPFRIVYTGMLYEGHRDPTPLLDALVELTRSGAIDPGAVTIDFYGGRVGLAHRLSNNPDYAPFIRLMGHVSRDEALVAQREADLLLLLESPAPEARGILTGKLFEYMAAGRPILCVGSSPEYEIGQVLSSTGTGSVYGPDRYVELEDIINQTIRGAGLCSAYKPRIDEIMRFSRKQIAIDMMTRLHS